MLDFNLINQKISEMTNYLTEVEFSNKQGLNSAKKILPQAHSEHQKLAELLDNYASQMMFSAALGTFYF
ncbi:MAG: hypothetical protein QNJ54_25815 [Prochloraceae cyanobacterium]|nr:hypothetical protein [Prochloraceae cyanobacterium]